MFSQRRNSQKPGEELYAAFKQSFPEIGPGTSSVLLGPSQQPSTLSEALITGTPTQRDFEDDNDSEEQDVTPKPPHEGWRLTPSLMDPNSFAFSAIANQPPGYYTPTPSGFNTLYHSQAGDLHTPGGKLLAVEYVYPSQGGDDGIRKSQVELEKAAFDGFAVTWYPNQMAGVPDCSISVRFNFLSTDFSHSKGVKGIPVRLCAKTELITPLTSSTNEPEVCFSKVKLFRDHGAERKLSNDVSHVKKTIEKLKQQIAQAETGLGGSGKRKRSGSVAKTVVSKPGKVIKHKRTWSIDADVEGGRPAGEEDLHTKLATIQDMFSSTRPVSILFLRGEPDDDPDLHPVKLPGGESVEPKSPNKSMNWESRLSNSDSPISNQGSPTSSSTSQPTPKRKFLDMQQSSRPEEPQDEVKAAAAIENAESPRPVKIMRLESEMKPQSDILAFDVDSSYQPPLERSFKPVACFYIRGKDDSTEYYRAVYLMRRTVRDLIDGISRKFQIDPIRVTQVTHVNTKGLHIVVDEDVVREVPEGQDMLVEFAPAQANGQIKQEFATPAASELADNIIDPDEISVYDPLEMWLNY
ncbi:hypothetical protein DV737_g2318, partial [Chaetothyriales sp. CBS 132003]